MGVFAIGHVYDHMNTLDPIIGISTPSCSQYNIIDKSTSTVDTLSKTSVLVPRFQSESVFNSYNHDTGQCLQSLLPIIIKLLISIAEQQLFDLIFSKSFPSVLEFEMTSNCCK